MRTVLVGDGGTASLYTLQDPDAPTENQFERAVARGLTSIYSGYRCVLFGGSFKYDERCYRPDLALVAIDFSHWYIIEVELLSHSFEQHVLPQVLAFRYGDPQADCVSVLARELGISPERARTLLGHVPRSVAVVANRRDNRWQVALGAHGVQMLAVSVFRSSAGGEAVEIDGVLEIIEESLGFGTYSATDRSLRFPKAVKLPNGLVQINNPDGSTSFWTVVRDLDATWVTKQVGSPDISDGSYVQIIRTIDGKLSLRRPI